MRPSPTSHCFVLMGVRASWCVRAEYVYVACLHAACVYVVGVHAVCAVFCSR
jgi:hypothetical protein